MPARHKAYLFLLTVAILWGIAPPLIKYTFAYLPPDIFLTYRFLISSFIMIPLLLWTEPHILSHLGRLEPSEWFWLLLGGVLGSSVQLGLLFWGLDLTSSIEGSIIGAMSPIFVALAGHYFISEHIGLRKRLGLAIAFLGSVIVVIDPLLSSGFSLSKNGSSILGNILVMMGALAWVGYIITTKLQLRQKLSPLLLTTNMFFTGFVSMSVLVILRYHPSDIVRIISQAALGAHMAVFYMAVFSGSIAYWLYQRAQKTITASEANIFSYLSPVFTYPLSVLWLRESITPAAVVGCLVIASGVVVSELLH